MYAAPNKPQPPALEERSRRSFYLVALLLGFAAGLSQTLLGGFLWFQSFYETLVPVVLAALALLALLLWVRPDSLKLVEWGILAVLCSYNLLVLEQLLYGRSEPHMRIYLEAFLMFSPPIYVWSFLAFKRRRGLQVSLLFIASTLALAAPYLLHLTPARAEHDVVQGFLLSVPTLGGVYIAMLYTLTHFLEVSNQVRARAEAVAELAYKDPLTGLPNRLLFDTHLTQACKSAQRDQGGFALAFIDLDNFKTVNDTLGHHAGDLLLKEVAARLKTQLRAADLLARISGDEFAALLPAATTPAGVNAVAAKLIETLQAPFDLKGVEYQVSASVGFAIYQTTTGTPDALLAQADQAMYCAKKRGKNGFYLYA